MRRGRQRKVLLIRIVFIAISVMLLLSMILNFLVTLR